MKIKRGYILIIIFFIVLLLPTAWWLSAKKRIAQDPLYVDFYVSLNSAAYRDKITSSWACYFLGICEKLYANYNFNKIPEGKKLLIPKVIHQIWLGSPFPEKYRQWQQSWIKHHPDWEYRLWQDVDIDAFNLENRAAYDAVLDYGARSDIARYEILYRIGWLNIDTDYECLRSFDTLNKRYNFYVGIQPLDVTIPQLGIGLIGAAPGHPILRVCIDKISKSVKSTSRTVAATGPLYFSKIFCQVAPSCKGPLVALPPTYFYPRGYTQENNKAYWQRPESFAVHHWHGSWLTPEGRVRS
jgi:mannosyltransferase OCH1-like enzyme